MNWAIVHGETQTGASLHYMVAKPDAGNLVDSQAVAIGPDDTAVEVAARVADAAVVVLSRNLDGLIAGTALGKPMDLSAGSYFGGRRPADGEFQWTWTAQRIHNLVRAVAPPFPGAFALVAGTTLRLHRSRLIDSSNTSRPIGTSPMLYTAQGRLMAVCGDGQILELVEAWLGEKTLDAAHFAEHFGNEPLRLT